MRFLSRCLGSVTADDFIIRTFSILQQFIVKLPIKVFHYVASYMLNIINLSETENLVTVMTCNEIFDPGHPDTFGEPV